MACLQFAAARKASARWAVLHLLAFTSLAMLAALSKESGLMVVPLCLVFDFILSGGLDTQRAYSIFAVFCPLAPTSAKVKKTVTGAISPSGFWLRAVILGVFIITFMVVRLRIQVLPCPSVFPALSMCTLPLLFPS